MPNPTSTEAAVATLPTYAFWLTMIGAFFFGLVVGWVTYSTLRRVQRGGLTDIATIIGAVAGAAVTGLFPTSTGAFGTYCIGFALGFFGYIWVAWKNPTSSVVAWMGEAPRQGVGAGGRTQLPIDQPTGQGGLPPDVE